MSKTGAWWPVDKLILGYLSATGLLILLFASRIPWAFSLLGLHVVAAALVVFVIRQATPWSWVFRHWYPLPYVAGCYKEMSIFIDALRGTHADAHLARLDFAFWGAHPTVWLECIQAPWLTESLQVVYALFLPVVLVVAAILWWQRRFAEFRYYAFLISLGFLVSYVGYFLVPARGPRFFMPQLQHAGLRGFWLFEPLQKTLDWLESAHYDCFPSGHTELTILAWWSSRQISAILYRVFFVYTLCIIFATVYLRYHYTVDLLAGAVVAVALLVVSPHLYRILGKGL